MSHCVHCFRVAKGKPLACRRCGDTTPCMYDVGSLAASHDHFELCETCFRAGVTREQLQRQRARIHA